MTLRRRVAKLEAGKVDKEVTHEELVWWSYHLPPSGPEQEEAYADLERRWQTSSMRAAWEAVLGKSEKNCV